jgi:hypothetical protein
MTWIQWADGVVAVTAYLLAIYYASDERWRKAIFFMALATNHELGYQAARLLNAVGS